MTLSRSLVCACTCKMGKMTMPVLVRVEGGHLSAGLRAVPSVVSLQAKLNSVIGVIIISCCL